MADQTKIPWADATWNPMTGCTPVSEACDHCYAERIAGRNLPATRCPTCGGSGHRSIVLSAGDPDSVGTQLCRACHGTGNVGFRPTFHPNRLDKPLHWRQPRRIFVCSMSDLFHEAFTDEQICSVLVRALFAPQHTYMVLTKRPERMPEVMEMVRFSCINDLGVAFPLPNLWLGVTVENSANLWRLDVLRDTPAAVRFVSMEPLLGDVCNPNYNFHLGGIDWVILGGETGPGARPMQPEWALDVWRQCKAAGVPFFWKSGSKGLVYDAQMTAMREVPGAV